MHKEKRYQYQISNNPPSELNISINIVSNIFSVMEMPMPCIACMADMWSDATTKYKGQFAILINELAHGVKIEPWLQPLSGEVLSTETTTDDEARLDFAGRDFWKPCEMTYFPFTKLHLKTSSASYLILIIFILNIHHIPSIFKNGLFQRHVTKWMWTTYRAIFLTTNQEFHRGRNVVKNVGVSNIVHIGHGGKWGRIVSSKGAHSVTGTMWRGRCLVKTVVGRKVKLFGPLVTEYQN